MTALLETTLTPTDDDTAVAGSPTVLSPGRRVERVSGIFERTLGEIMELIPSAQMRKLISKQLHLAEAATCRAVLQQRR